MLRSPCLADSWKKLALPLMVAAACVAFNGPAGAVVTTPTSFGVDLFLTTDSDIGPGGTPVTSITGTVNGVPVIEDAVFGADQTIYSTNGFVDAFGLGFTETGSPFSSFALYDLGTAGGPNYDNATPGPYGLCYVATCDNVSGFYSVSDLSWSEVAPLLADDATYHVTFTASVPEPSSIALLAVALLGFGLWGRHMRRRLLSSAG